MAQRPTKAYLKLGAIVKRETTSKTGKFAKFYEVTEVNEAEDYVVLANVEDPTSANRYKPASVRRMFFVIEEGDKETLELRKQAEQEVAEEPKPAAKPKAKPKTVKGSGPRVATKRKAKAAEPTKAEVQEEQKPVEDVPVNEVSEETLSEKTKKRNSRSRKESQALEKLIVDSIAGDAAMAGAERYETTQYQAFKRSSGYVFVEISTARKGHVRLAMRGAGLDESVLKDGEKELLKRLPKTYGYSLDTVFMVTNEKDIAQALRFVQLSYSSALR